MLRSLITAFLLVNYLSLDVFGAKTPESRLISRNLRRKRRNLGKKSKKESHDGDDDDGISRCTKETVYGSVEEIINCVSSEVDLENSDSAQAKAADWILDKDKYPFSTDSEEGVYQVIQRYVLAVYYYSTGGDTWIQCKAVTNDSPSDCDAAITRFYTGRDNFLSAADECYWFSIGCQNGIVTDIRLAGNNNLTGTIPPEIGELVHLEDLDLFRNDIGGQIPSEIGNLKKLKFMDATLNAFTGTIPDTMFELTELSHLDLKANQLTGSLPDKFNRLSDLKFIYLSKNQFTGSLPSSLGGSVPMMSNVKIISLTENQFTGPIPDTWYGGLPNLETLDITDNSLTGNLSPEIKNWGSLRVLFMDKNRFSGMLPSELSTENMPGLKSIFMSDNNFTGAIPSGLCDVTVLKDDDKVEDASCLKR